MTPTIEINGAVRAPECQPGRLLRAAPNIDVRPFARPLDPDYEYSAVQAGNYMEQFPGEVLTVQLSSVGFKWAYPGRVENGVIVGLSVAETVAAYIAGKLPYDRSEGVGLWAGSELDRAREAIGYLNDRGLRFEVYLDIEGIPDAWAISVPAVKQVIAGLMASKTFLRQMKTEYAQRTTDSMIDAVTPLKDGVPRSLNLEVMQNYYRRIYAVAAKSCGAFLKEAGHGGEWDLIDCFGNHRDTQGNNGMPLRTCSLQPRQIASASWGELSDVADPDLTCRAIAACTSYYGKPYRAHYSLQNPMPEVLRRVMYGTPDRGCQLFGVPEDLPKLADVEALVVRMGAGQ